MTEYSMAYAIKIWGEQEVRKALAYPSPAPLTTDLADMITQHSQSPGLILSWAKKLDRAQFCAVVRVVAGVTSGT